MATFENPNEPVQPQRGVYGWYALKDGSERVTIYVGMAGQKQSILQKGTLFRGISELQRNTFSQKYPECSYLDTDFIVGTAIIFFETKGYKCIWRHLSNDPREELTFVNSEKPILQDIRNAKILDVYRMKSCEEHYWSKRKNKEGVQEAENKIWSILEHQYFNSR